MFGLLVFVEAVGFALLVLELVLQLLNLIFIDVLSVLEFADRVAVGLTGGAKFLELSLQCEVGWVLVNLVWVVRRRVLALQLLDLSFEIANTIYLFIV